MIRSTDSLEIYSFIKVQIKEVSANVKDRKVEVQSVCAQGHKLKNRTFF